MALIVFSWPGVYFRWWHFPVGKRILFVWKRLWYRNMMKCLWGSCSTSLPSVFDLYWEAEALFATLMPEGLLYVTFLSSESELLMSLYHVISLCAASLKMNSWMIFRFIWSTSPWILSICPSFSAAPRTLQSVRTILWALASDRKALESSMDFFSPEEQTNHSVQT